MYTLIFLRRHFEEVVSTRLHQPHTPVISRAGRNRLAMGTALLCRPATIPMTDTHTHTDEDRVFIEVARTPAAFHQAWAQVPSFRGHQGTLTALLTVGVEAARGWLSGAVIDVHGTRRPLAACTLIGPGMPTILLIEQPARPTPWSLDPAVSRYSRTMGALGGEEVWQRCRSMHACVLGVGRTGSLIAVTLAKLGVAALTLIDPDLVEDHNLDMDGVTPGAVGRPKVAAVAEHLRLLRADLSLRTLTCRLTAPRAIAAIKSCDVLFCCVDNDTGRLATTTLATLYLKPLVDIGTGVFLEPRSPDQASPRVTLPPRRQMGSDVRLLLPGDACLLCCGGLVHDAEARAQLAGHILTGTDAPWAQRRAGSLRPLNQLAAHLGVQMWLDLLTERMRDSAWAHLEFDEAGHLHTQYPRLAHTPPCVLCARAGGGDGELGERV